MRAEWFVLFPSTPSASPPSLDTFVARLRAQGFRAEANRSNPSAPCVEVSKGPLRLFAVLNTGQWVAEESAEIAAEHATTEADRAAIERCNARFEITWPLDDSAEITNFLAIVTETVCQLVETGSYVFDTGFERLV